MALGAQTINGWPIAQVFKRAEQATASQAATSSVPEEHRRPRRRTPSREPHVRGLQVLGAPVCRLPRLVFEQVGEAHGEGVAASGMRQGPHCLSGKHRCWQDQDGGDLVRTRLSSIALA